MPEADDVEAAAPRAAPVAADSPYEAGRFGVFVHLTTEGADVYRRIMAAFVTAKERFQVHLRPEDVYSELLLGRSGPVGTHVWALGVCPGPARFGRDRAVASAE